MDFLDLDYANPYFQELLRQDTDPETENWADYETLRQYALEVYHLQLVRSIRPEQYEEAVRSLRSYQPPEACLRVSGLDEESIALAHMITEGCTNTYDACKAVETYLRTMTYGSPRESASEEDFLNSFLQEEKTGTCMYFASAMVMLLRANGIPARLAEGYSACYGTQKQNGRYVVTGDEAHAWPEAYLKGYGWIRFEPTPSLKNAEDLAWGLTLDGDRKRWEVGEGQKPRKEEEIEDSPAAEENAGISARLLWLAGACFPGFLLLLMLADRLLRRRQFRRKALAEKLSVILGDIRLLVSLARDCPELVEQPYLYTSDCLEGQAGERLRTQILAYYACRYKDQAPVPEQLAELLAIRTLAEKELFSKPEYQEDRIAALKLRLSLLRRLTLT